MMSYHPSQVKVNRPATLATVVVKNKSTHVSVLSQNIYWDLDKSSKSLPSIVALGNQIF